MSAFLNSRNGTGLTSIIYVTTHNISLFQENEQTKDINDMFVPKTYIPIPELVDVQIYEKGNNSITMYHLIGIINDEK